MFCKNCGTQVTPGTKYCPNCGEKVQNEVANHPFEPSTPTDSARNTTPPTPATSPTPSTPSTPSPVHTNPPYPPKNPKTVPPAVIILLLIFFFPVGLFLMWKYAKWPKIVKILITILIALCFFLSLSAPKEDGTPTNASSSVASSSSAPQEPESSSPASEPVASQLDSNIQTLMSGANLTEEQAVSLFQNLNDIGVLGVYSCESMAESTPGEDTHSYLISASGIRTVMMLNSDGTLYYVSSGDITLFDEEKGGALDNLQDYVLESGDDAKFMIAAQSYVEQGLKAPSTAKFPGTVLERDSWTVARHKNIVSVASYVDSQNGFGAMIRSNFLVQMSYDTSECLYLQIDDTVVFGERQE